MGKKIDDLRAKVAASKGAKSRKSRRAAAAAAAAANELMSPDAAMAALFDNLAKECGGGVISSAHAEKLVIGIEMPALCLRMFYGQDVWPLGRAEMIVGPPGTCKSTFMAEKFAWGLSNLGLAMLCENESKDGPDFRNALLRCYDPSFPERLKVKPTDSQNDWMSTVEALVAAAEEKFQKVVKSRTPPKKRDGETAADYRERIAPKANKKAPGWIYPIIIGVDSITATSSDKTIDDIRSDGTPKRRFAIEASYLSDWAKTLPSKFRGRPIGFVAVNHYKPVMDQTTGMPVRGKGIPGGEAMRFMDTVEILMKRETFLPRHADHGGLRIRMTMLKSSLGETNTSIVVDLKWWWHLDEATGALVKHVKWDWDTASIESLISHRAIMSKKTRAQLDDLLDLTVSKKRVWSNALGIPESSPVSLSEAGRLLEQKIQSDRSFRDALYTLLHITRRTIFTPGVDFSLVDHHLKMALEDRRPVYASYDLTEVDYISDQLDAAKAKAAAKAAAKAKRSRDDDDDDDDDD